jgi:hypothetical protein
MTTTSRTGRSLLGLLPALAILASAQTAAAKDPDSFMRVLFCEGEDARMEVYLPLALTVHGDAILNMKPAIGWYALDLSSALKGKPLEPVRVSISPDRKFVVVDQYTRGLPPTRIPVAGGTVDFDQRFGKNAKCAAFNSRE